MSETVHKVTIVEDDPLILDIITFKFKKQGWDVTSAMDGESGLEKIAQQKPDIILLDILLPGISGYEVLEKLKQTDDLKDIPVLILSNYGQEEEINKSLALGAVDHLVKANVILDEVVENAKRIIDGEYTRTAG